MGPGAGVLILLILGGSAVVRAWAARRVRIGDRRMVPVLLLSTLLIALVIAGVGVWMAFRSPLIGVVVTVAALLLGGGWLRVSLDTARYAGPPRPQPDRFDALAARMDASYRSVAAILLAIGFGGLILGVLYLFGRGRF
jgi:hypothetical protein